MSELRSSLCAALRTGPRYAVSWLLGPVLRPLPKGLRKRVCDWGIRDV